MASDRAQVVGAVNVPPPRLAACVAVLAVAATSGSAAAQTVFRTATDMVVLNVTATRGQQIVGGLPREAFTVLEDGRPQEIQVFSRDPQPIALSLLIDTSTSMEDRMTLAADAAVGFIQRLRPDDIAQVVTFNDSAEIRQAFTADQRQLEQAIRTAQPHGSTSLYTALYVAFAEFERLGRQTRGDVRRQAIVLLSDGEDTAGLLTGDDVIERARRSDVIVFAIVLRGGSTSTSYDFALRSMAQATGGRVMTVTSAAELPAIYTQIADELATQYTIGYISNAPERRGWRPVTVRIDAPGVVARTRAGYLASPHTR